MASISPTDLISFVNERSAFNSVAGEAKQMILKATDPSKTQSVPDNKKCHILVHLAAYNNIPFLQQPSVFTKSESFRITLRLFENLMKNNQCQVVENEFANAILSLSELALLEGNEDGSLIAIFNETYNKNKLLCHGYVRECISEIATEKYQNADVTKYFGNIVYDFQFETNSVINHIMHCILKCTENYSAESFPEVTLRRSLIAIGQILHESEIFPFVSNSMDDIMRDLIDYHLILRHFHLWLHVEINIFTNGYNYSMAKKFKAIIFRMLTQFMKFDQSMSAKIIENDLFHAIVSGIGFVYEGYAKYENEYDKDDAFEYEFDRDDALECLLLFIQIASEKDLRYAINAEINGYAEIFSCILLYVNICGLNIKNSNRVFLEEGTMCSDWLYEDMELLQRLLSALERVIQFGDGQTMRCFEQKKGLAIISSVKLILLERRDDIPEKTFSRDLDSSAGIKSCDVIINAFDSY